MAGNAQITNFEDARFTVYDTDDITRIMGFDLSSITTGNTRTITAADRDLNLATPVFDTVTAGASYQAVLGDDGNTRSGYFTAGSTAVTIASSTYAGLFSFGGGERTVTLADTTYAINATGDCNIVGDVNIASDSSELLLGAAQDVGIGFDGSDMNISSKNVTADDELNFTDFTSYNFDSSVTMGDLTAENGVFNSTTFPVLDITRTTTSGGGMFGGVKMERVNSAGVGQDGGGVGFYFKAEDSAGNSTFSGNFGGVLASVTNGSEIGRLVFNASWVGHDPLNNTQMTLTATSQTTADLALNGNLQLTTIKSGATQVAAGAAANEVWKTASHATLPDNVLMIGV